MAGYVENEVLRGAMSGCDLYLFPTLEENEGIPIIEACASETDAIIRDIPVFEDWLEDGVNVYKAKDIDDFEQWLEYTAKWSTNSKWADDATAVLTAMLRVKPMKFFVENSKNFKDKIEGIIPYLERHMQRLDRLHTQTYLIDHILDSTSLE